MKAEIKNTLDSIVGKEFSFEGENITINRYKDVSGANIIIFINGRPRNFLPSEIPGFIDKLHEPLKAPLKETQIAIPKTQLFIYEPTAENKEVKKTLLETLKKVKENPNYIPQAEAICGVVNQIVAVQKTEIQMLNIISKNKK